MENSGFINGQIRKFGFYGLLKNLQFFEPYLMLYLLFSKVSFTEIGVLYAIRSVIVNVFEIPSGVLADRFGKKNELVMSFLFYIASFIMFYFAHNFVLFIIPMVLYGLGEAFRSGTHKAMIMQYLDHNDEDTEKRQVYGFTRSYSNIGSVISSVFGIILILYIPNLKFLFLVAVIPYIADLFLILSYPNYLNQKADHEFHLKAFLKENWNSIKYTVTSKKLFGYVVDSSSFTAVFKILRDYIQPLIYGAGITYLLIANKSLDINLKVYIGLTYMIAQLISVFVTKNAYKLRNHLATNVILLGTWLMAALVAIILGVFNQAMLIIVIAFILFYAAQNIRKPFMVQKIGDLTIANKRASVLSIESQVSSLWMVVFAPLLGVIADHFGIGVMMIIIGCLMALWGLIMNIKKSA